ncbi:RNA polymerase sigma factor [Planococcus lenghuensis]|uniref:RNA polymerase subunit sigma-70 n=1 Tax=Planococcus lenghuensis TaxID=2213202 RepID=A0A1Q2KYH9_9BACL|nr:sigma-70 family RNA polymerase sigma factor [Planococcus lenghuensis]AQQ53268.1 RNA polymerase subunit sigma-70 [Planococcus lenghuensis]
MEEEIEQLYREHSDAVYRYLFLLVRNKETAEDLTQDAFFKAFKRLSSYRGEASEATWLMRIARNVTYDHFRRKRIIRFFSFEEDRHDTEDLETPEFSALRKEEAEELYAAISTLKQDYKDVIILRKVQEYSIKDTAFILGWTEAKVKTKQTRALDALKRAYGRKGEFLNEPVK